MNSKIYLNVPFDEKERVKKLGAKWDPVDKGWFISIKTNRKPFSVWLPEMYKLNRDAPAIMCNLIPQENWGKNVRTYLSKDEWWTISRYVLELSGKRCNVCGSRSQGRSLDCHEHWEYVFDNQSLLAIQVLKDLYSLCQRCHAVVHAGRSIAHNKAEEVVDHLMFVNNWTYEESCSHINQAIQKWEEYNNRDWAINLTYIDDFYKKISGQYPDNFEASYSIKLSGMIKNVGDTSKNLNVGSRKLEKKRTKHISMKIFYITSVIVFISLLFLNIDWSKSPSIDHSNVNAHRTTNKHKLNSSSTYISCEPVTNSSGRMCKDKNGQWNLVN